MTHQKRSLDQLHANPKNPRKVTRNKLTMLANALREFGDLGGVIFNIRTNQLVGGHQRTSVWKSHNPDVVITDTYDGQTATGTVREGYILIDGERHKYREVDWSEEKEQAANLAANKGAGEFDQAQLKEWIDDLGNLEFDLDLTMFDEAERNALGAEPTTEPDADTTDHQIDEAYRILIDCSDESHQFELMERFNAEGLQCKPLIS